MPDLLHDLGRAWREARDVATFLHLDSAACGRTSRSVREATARHAALESEIGGYEAEAAAEPLLTATRAALATLFGYGPAAGACVGFVESATAGLTALLDAWPLRPGARVLVGWHEYGPAVTQLRSRGLEVVAVAPEDLADAVQREAPDLVHATQLASHRGTGADVAAVARATYAAGVPLWVDAAQSLGHLDCAVAPSAIYATSRKWLSGPRGVGIVAVHPDDAGRLDLAHLGSHEAHVAGRVGLATALRDHLALGPERVREGLAAIGDLTRQILDGVGGWRVADGPDARGALVSLSPPAGVDALTTRTRLLAEHAILTTAALPARAPLDPVATRGLIRVSPHLGTTVDDLRRLAAALGP